MLTERKACSFCGMERQGKYFSKDAVCVCEKCVRAMSNMLFPYDAEYYLDRAGIDMDEQK